MRTHEEIQRTALRWEWRRLGTCAQIDIDAWFPEASRNIKAQRRVCALCPVRPECLSAAFQRGERGVWGGIAERARDAIALPDDQRRAVMDAEAETSLIASMEEAA